MRKDNKIQAKRKRPARKELLRAKRGKKVLKKNSPSKLLPRPPTIKKKKKKSKKLARGPERLRHHAGLRGRPGGFEAAPDSLRRPDQGRRRPGGAGLKRKGWMEGGNGEESGGRASERGRGGGGGGSNKIALLPVLYVFAPQNKQQGA